MQQPKYGELKHAGPVAAHGIPPVGRVGMYQADISSRYLGSIYRAHEHSICNRSLLGNRRFHLAIRGPLGIQARRGRRGRRTLWSMASRRSVVDYGLARRATLASVHAGHTTLTDVCDAHPYLLRAAKFHGEATGIRCPICRKNNLTHVTYVYGDELGQYAGRVKRGPELTEMAAEYGEFRVYVVEVCQSCGWNHLATSYVLGTGEPPARRGRRARSGQ
jgi:Family of unknown function (DUF5318)